MMLPEQQYYATIAHLEATNAPLCGRCTERAIFDARDLTGTIEGRYCLPHGLELAATFTPASKGTFGFTPEVRRFLEGLGYLPAARQN
jgi:hypothetical protein